MDISRATLANAHTVTLAIGRTGHSTNSGSYSLIHFHLHSPNLSHLHTDSGSITLHWHESC